MTGGEVNSFTASGNLDLELPFGRIVGAGNLTKVHTDYGACLDAVLENSRRPSYTGSFTSDVLAVCGRPPGSRDP